MNRFLEDARYGARLLWQSKGFTAAAILALALGIGANSAVFSVVDAVLIRPLPYADPDRLVMVWEDVSAVGFPRNTPAPANWVDWRKRNSSFVDIAATRGGALNLTGAGAPERIIGRRVTANFWPVMGTQPLLGRVFTEQEDETGSRVAVVAYGFWQNRLGGDPNLAAHPLELNGEQYQVIGVMPRGFSFNSRRVEIWTPAAFTPKDLANRGSHYLVCVGRLKQGVSLKQAQTEMSAIAAQLSSEHPSENKQVGVTLVALKDDLLGNTQTALLALLIAAGCVLLIACANIANLLLARGVARQREFALRTALGAGQWRLFQQLVTESLLLAILGAAAGLAVARVGMLALQKLIPNSMSEMTLRLDARVLLFTLGVSVLTGLLFGAGPAVVMSWLNPSDVLKQGGRGSAGGRSHWFRDSLVVGQVALALMLLCGAGLMIQTLYRFQQVDPGFRTDHLLTIQTPFPPSRFADYKWRTAFVDTVLEKVRSLPGVTSAAYTSALPLVTQGNTSGYLLEGQQEKDSQLQDALFRVVTADYFATLKAQLREGRWLAPTDHADAPAVVLVNETFADRHWPGQSAVGRRIQMGDRGPGKPWQTVVGVVKEIRERGIDIATKPAVYMPHLQGEKAWPIPEALVVRTAADPGALISAVRQVVWSVDKNIPLASIMTMDELAGIEISNRRQTMTLLAALAGLSLVLAFIGIYGVLAYSVRQRNKEIGIRLALGANGRTVISMVAGRGLLLACGGVAIGLIGSIAGSRWLQSLLYEVRPNDPGTLTAVAVCLLAVATLASALPAWRASKVDPAMALREE